MISEQNAAEQKNVVAAGIFTREKPEDDIPIFGSEGFFCSDALLETSEPGESGKWARLRSVE